MLVAVGHADDRQSLGLVLRVERVESRDRRAAGVSPVREELEQDGAAVEVFERRRLGLGEVTQVEVRHLGPDPLGAQRRAGQAAPPRRVRYSDG